MSRAKSFMFELERKLWILGLFLWFFFPQSVFAQKSKSYTFSKSFSYGDVVVKEKRSPHGICTYRDIYLKHDVGLNITDYPNDIFAADVNCDGSFDYVRSRDTRTIEMLLNAQYRERVLYFLTFLLYATLPIEHHPTVW